MSPPGKAVKVAEAELRKHLTPEQYYVTRDHGTEHPFTGPHLHESGPACFRAYVAERRCSMRGRSPGPAGRAMHRSGPDAVSEYTDRALFFIRRTEVRCASRDAHLGHVFPDGPRPTGRRYCMNGTAPTFTPGSEV